jgi:biotin operon repressor
VTLRRVLVEMTMTEQRYRAVLEVDAGVSVTEVAERFGVSRQAVHRWIGWYREEGLDGLANRSSRPGRHLCRLHRRWKRRSVSYAGPIRGGVPGASSSSWAATAVLAGFVAGHDPSGSGAAWPGRRCTSPPSSAGLSAVAAGGADGAVATGHR